MKTQETKQIEQLLFDGLFGTNPSLAVEYGTIEVKIGTAKNHKKAEYVDFMSYDMRKNIFRCYEIKVSLSDLKSKANMSWYGNYNYLVISLSLHREMIAKELMQLLPKHVGLIVADTENNFKWVEKKATYVEIEPQMEIILENSLLRALFYQNNKYRKMMQKINIENKETR